MTLPSTNDSYATMQSPDHHPAPGHLKKYSRIGGVDSQRPIAAPRRRYRNKQNKGINSSRSMYVSTSSGKTPSEREYHSDTYASMNGSRRYKEDTHIDSGYDVSTKSLSKALSLEFTSFNVPECTTHYAQNISPPLCDHTKLDSKHSRSSDDLCLNTEIRRKTETIYTAIVNSTDEEERNDKMEDTKEDGVKIRKYTKVLPKTRKARYTTSDNEQIEKNAESLNESSHEYAKLSPDVSPNNAGYIEKEYSYDTIVRDDHTSQTEN
uniref:Uncharacterized protein n=1 Tax=Ciona savignyi TaxID=51511 RepID=H2Z452_CIOSA